MPLTAAVPGGLTGLGVLGVDDAAVLIPLGGLQIHHGEGVVLHHGDGAAQQLLNGFQLGLLVKLAEGDGGAGVAGPARAANAVDVGLGHVGEVVVEHPGQLVDVNAPGGDVGGHQHPYPPRLEVVEGLDPGGLALVAVDGGGGDALGVEVPGDAVGPVLGAGEHQGGGNVPLLN